MSKRNPWGEFFQNFDSAYNLGNKVGMQIGLARAANVKPDAVTGTELTDTTPNQSGMVYDPDTGQYMPKYLENGKPTEQAQAQLNTPAEGTSEAPSGVQPTFSAKTTTRHRMGGMEQADPFTPEQIDAQRFRNQADVYTKFGHADKAAQLHGLAKGREEEGVIGQIRSAAMTGMKNTKDMRDEEKMFAMSKNMYEASIRLNRPDLATGYYNQMTQNRDALLARANDRADRVYRSTGNISGFVDAYNRYVADGNTIDQFKRADDGSYVFTVNDGTGNTRDIPVPKERVSEYLMAVRDPKRIAEIEQKRAEILYKAQVDAQEALNKPVAVGKDQTLVVPSTGQTFAPRQAGQFDVKEAGPVLDDARRMLLERSGNFDQATGKWNWSPETTAKAVVAERLFMKNPTLPPAMLAEIADKGATGMATIDVGGKQVKVPAVTHNGRTYILGGSDAGQALPDGVRPGTAAQTEMPMTPAAALLNKKQLAPREVSGKISGGMQKAEAVSYNSPELDQIAVSAAQESGIPPKLLLAIKNAGEKSNNDQVSKKGAAGVMQFMPETAKAYGVDSTNPASAIKGAGRYLADLIKQYRGNVAAAVAHYNGGSTQGALVAAGKPPTYPETRAYLERVLAASEAPA